MRAADRGCRYASPVAALQVSVTFNSASASPETIHRSHSLVREWRGTPFRPYPAVFGSLPTFASIIATKSPSDARVFSNWPAAGLLSNSRGLPQTGRTRDRLHRTALYSRLAIRLRFCRAWPRSSRNGLNQSCLHLQSGSRKPVCRMWRPAGGGHRRYLPACMAHSLGRSDRYIGGYRISARTWRDYSPQLSSTRVRTLMVHHWTLFCCNPDGAAGDHAGRSQPPQSCINEAQR